MADDQPQQWYSYIEIAHLCRRTPRTIRLLVAKHKLPKIRQYGTRRAERIILVPSDAVATLQQLTVGRQTGKHGH